MAATPIEESQDIDWAYRTLDSTESARKDRIAAYKILLQNQFPGVSFDDTNEVYQAICKDYGRMRKGVLLQAQAMNLEAVKAEDRANLESLLRGQHRPFHRLPKTYIKAAVMERLGVLALLNGQPWSNTDTRAIAIKRTALRYADEIQYWLRLTVKADQSPSEIANKLLKKLGLTVASTGRPGKRNEPRDRVYEIEDFHNPVRAKLLLAACNRLSDAVSTSCKRELAILIQLVDTRPKSAVEWAIGAVTTHLKTGARLLIEEIQGAIATVSDDFNRVLTIPLSELAELS